MKNEISDRLRSTAGTCPALPAAEGAAAAPARPGRSQSDLCLERSCTLMKIANRDYQITGFFWLGTLASFACLF